jgi:hypothetical protein
VTRLGSVTSVVGSLGTLEADSLLVTMGVLGEGLGICFHLLPCRYPSTVVTCQQI